MKKVLIPFFLLISNSVFAQIPHEMTYKYNDKEMAYGYFNQSGYVSLSNDTIQKFITKSDHTQWLAFGIRNFKPFYKDNDYWIWRTSPIPYKGLTIIGIGRGVCNITGDDHCGMAGSTTLIFEETESQIKSKKLKISEYNMISSMKFLNKNRGIITTKDENL